MRNGGAVFLLPKPLNVADVNAHRNIHHVYETLASRTSEPLLVATARDNARHYLGQDGWYACGVWMADSNVALTRSALKHQREPTVG